jgi:hypothetical protein
MESFNGMCHQTLGLNLFDVMSLDVQTFYQLDKLLNDMAKRANQQMTSAAAAAGNPTLPPPPSKPKPQARSRR